MIDPRTGWPVERIRSASAIAADAATADAVATVLSVVDPDDGLAFADRTGVAALVIDDADQLHANQAWQNYRVVR